MRLALATAAVLALAACDKPAAPAAAPPPVATVAPVAPAPAVAPVTPPVVMATYLCVGGKTLEAGYPTPTTVLVVWQGNAYTLTQATAASGARYTGFGQQWWSKGMTDATLSALKPGEDVATDPGMACKAQLTGAVTAATGAAGALAPDGTPIVPVTTGPTSAQGAVGVVQAYYGLLEKRNSVAAAANRIDATPENLSQYAAIHAQVGAAGVIVTTATYQTVDVPVVLTGRMTDGAAFTKTGKAALKRVNDAASPWRIDRVVLK